MLRLFNKFKIHRKDFIYLSCLKKTTSYNRYGNYAQNWVFVCGEKSAGVINDDIFFLFSLQYFSDTAHNPKTNPRPRLKSPEHVGEHRRSSTVPSPSNQRTVTPQKLAKTSIKQPVGVVQQRVPFMESEPIYNQLMWPDQKIGELKKIFLITVRLFDYVNTRSINI